MMINLAVFGAGHWGPNLIRNFHNKDTSLVRWVVDRSEERLQQVRRRFPEARTSVDPTQALTDPAVDAVVVATPSSTHFALARAAMQAGKHVLVEKPITTSSREGEELLSMARTTGRVLMVGHVFVYNGAVRTVRRYLQEGRLGPVHYISMVRTNLGPIRMDVGAAWDLAAHDISIADYWLGTTALSVSAMGGVWINPGVEDAVFATLRYPDNVLVSLHASWLNPRKARDITVVGEARMLTFDDMNLNEPIRIYDKHVSDESTQPVFVDNFASFRASVRDGDITIPKVALGEPLKEECDHFLECIRTGREPITNARQGVEVVRVLEAIQRSIAGSGREEEVRA